MNCLPQLLPTAQRLAGTPKVPVQLCSGQAQALTSQWNSHGRSSNSGNGTKWQAKAVAASLGWSNATSFFVLLLCLLALTAQAQPAAGRGHGAGLPPAVSHSLIGVWRGQLPIPGKVLPISLTITDASNRLTAVLETPVAQLNGHELLVTQRHDTLRFFDPLTEARYECLPSPDGKLLIGQWQQIGGFNNLLLLWREGLVPASGAQRGASPSIAGGIK